MHAQAPPTSFWCCGPAVIAFICQPDLHPYWHHAIYFIYMRADWFYPAVLLLYVLSSLNIVYKLW